MVAVNSGGAAGEVFSVVQKLQDASLTGDVDAWYREWSGLAERVEATAGQELAEGSEISAGETYQRAAIYHQICDRVLEFDDLRKLPAYQRSMACFEKSLDVRAPEARSWPSRTSACACADISCRPAPEEPRP